MIPTPPFQSSREGSETPDANAWRGPDGKGGLRYTVYGQDGELVRLTCQDTPEMRRFAEWLRRFDRRLPVPSVQP